MVEKNKFVRLYLYKKKRIMIITFPKFELLLLTKMQFPKIDIQKS